MRRQLLKPDTCLIRTDTGFRRCLVLGVLFTLVWCVAAARAAAVMTPSIVDPAVAIAASLANDTMTGVQSNAALIETEAAKLSPPAPKLAAAARSLHGTAKIADARTAFGRMNDELVAYMDAHKLTIDPSTRIAVCPMVNKPWLQKDAAIRNPYFGKEMLTCGSFKK